MRRLALATVVLVGCSPAPEPPPGGTTLGAAVSSFADEQTVALWLFDERQYGYTTLTDASIHEHDLLLMEDGALEPGRFGQAMRARPGTGFHVSFAGWQSDLVNENMRGPDGDPSGMWGP